MDHDKSPADSSLLESLNMTNFLPDEQAPPVDETKIRQLLNTELEKNEADKVVSCVRSYRNWNRACSRILGESIEDQ